MHLINDVGKSSSIDSPSTEARAWLDVISRQHPLSRHERSVPVLVYSTSLLPESRIVSLPQLPVAGLLLRHAWFPTEDASRADVQTLGPKPKAYQRVWHYQSLRGRGASNGRDSSPIIGYFTSKFCKESSSGSTFVQVVYRIREID